MPDTIAVRFEPPRGIRPAVAGVLFDGDIGVREIGVMLVDLSTRGWFRVEEESDGRWGLTSASRLPPAGDVASAAEVRLMDVLFRPGLSTLSGDCPVQYVSLTTIRHRLQGHVDEVGELLGQQLVDDGLMAKNPVKRRLGRRASLTAEGERVLEELKGYRLYLRTAESGPLQGADLGAHLHATMAYATALGVAEEWLARLEAEAPTQMAAIGGSLRGNPLLYGTAAGVAGGYSLENILGLRAAENYGARFPR